MGRRDSAMLADADIAAYRRDGQITPAVRLRADVMAAISEQMTGLFESRPDLDPDYIPHLIEIDRAWLQYAQDPTIRNVVEQIIGPDIIVWGGGAVLQAGDRRQGNSLASGWAVLADPAAGDGHRLDRDRTRDTGEWLPAGYSRQP